MRSFIAALLLLAMPPGAAAAEVRGALRMAVGEPDLLGVGAGFRVGPIELEGSAGATPMWERTAYRIQAGYALPLLDLRRSDAGLVLDLPLQLGVDIHSGRIHEEIMPNLAASLDAAWWFARSFGADVRVTGGGIIGFDDPLLRVAAGLVFR